MQRTLLVSTLIFTVLVGMAAAASDTSTTNPHTAITTDSAKRALDAFQNAYITTHGDNPPIIKGSAINALSGNGDTVRRYILLSIGERTDHSMQESLYTVLNQDKRKGRNPQTGKEIKIPAKAGNSDTGFQSTLRALLEAAHTQTPTTVPKFKPGAELSKKIK